MNPVLPPSTLSSRLPPALVSRRFVVWMVTGRRPSGSVYSGLRMIAEIRSSLEA